MYHLKVQNLEKFFNQSVFEGLNLSFQAQKGVAAVIGDNGSGKSTLLKIISGEDLDYSGSVNWSGYPSIGVMPQEIISTDLMSGGQKKIALLSQLLYSNQHDILILDEPDNHLDVESKLWLEGAIADFPGLVLLISHDREFLRRVSTHVWLIEDKKVRLFPYGFQHFEEVFQKEQETLEKRFEQEQKEKKRLEALVKRFQYIASYNSKKSATFHNMEKRLERHQNNAVDDPKKRLASIVIDTKNDSDYIKGKTAILIKDMTFSYPKNQIFRDANLHAFVQDKVGLVSPNGTGKSTLIKLLLGELMPTRGIVRVGDNLRVGYYSQDHQETLPKDQTPLELFLEKYPMNTYLAEGILKKYLFSPATQRSRIGVLSGGQKSRLQLALFLYQNPDILILDEPTNHLDLKSIAVLEDFLIDFKGTVFLVSHDRQLVAAVCDNVFTMVDKTLKKI